MMATSFRSVARACPACLTPRPSSPALAAPPAARYITHRHQRRHSSSKPPVPPDHGSPSIPAGSEGSVKSTSSRSKSQTEKRAGAESRLSKRRNKDKALSEQAAHESSLLKNLPSVPNTQYLQREDVHLASLFSTHRPISITSPLPGPVETGGFASIFDPRTKKNKNGPADVIYTLSSAVKVLDNVIQANGKTGSQLGSDRVSQMRDEIAKHTQGHGQDKQRQPQVQYFTDMKQALDELAKQFRPFDPPPAPVPMMSESEARDTEACAVTSSSAAEQNSEFPQDFVVVHQNEDGTLQSEFFTAHNATELYEIENPHSPSSLPLGISRNGVSDQPNTNEYSERYAPSSLPAQHQQEYQRRSIRNERTIHAISVKRQRKLKMKKHKYKKLMRKTRTLRRKLGQL